MIVFERFNEDARRALFFARATTSDRDGETITCEDLLSGIVTAMPDVAARFASERTETLTPREPGDFWLRLEQEKCTKEIPFSVLVILALERAVQEANDLAHTTIRPEHLLLGLLRDEHTQAWRTLHEAGVRLREVRRILGEEPSDPTPIE